MLPARDKEHKEHKEHLVSVFGEQTAPGRELLGSPGCPGRGFVPGKGSGLARVGFYEGRGLVAGVWLPPLWGEGEPPVHPQGWGHRWQPPACSVPGLPSPGPVLCAVGCGCASAGPGTPQSSPGAWLGAPGPGTARASWHSSATGPVPRGSRTGHRAAFVPSPALLTRNSSESSPRAQLPGEERKETNTRRGCEGGPATGCARLSPSGSKEQVLGWAAHGGDSAGTAQPPQVPTGAAP